MRNPLERIEPTKVLILFLGLAVLAVGYNLQTGSFSQLATGLLLLGSGIAALASIPIRQLVDNKFEPTKDIGGWVTLIVGIAVVIAGGFMALGAGIPMFLSNNILIPVYVIGAITVWTGIKL